jgi:hypothetical protein
VNKAAKLARSQPVAGRIAAVTGHTVKQFRDLPFRNESQRRAVQAFGAAGQVAHGFGIGAVAQFRLFGRQILLDHIGKGFLVDLAHGQIMRRIGTEAAFGGELAHLLAGLARRHRGEYADGHAPGLVIPRILIDPDFRSGVAHPQPEAAIKVVEKNMIGLAFG